MSHKLILVNPSDFSRREPIIISWQSIHKQTKIPADKLLLRDKDDNILPFQIDMVDPDDKSRDVLIFSPVKDITNGSSQYVTLEQTDTPVQEHVEATIDITNDRWIKLINSRLNVCINLAPAPWDDDRNWYAGSSNTVQLDSKEILDDFSQSWWGHDEEKRCMQVDQLRLWPPHMETTLDQEVTLVNQPYALITKSSGAIRASATIASKPFDYSYFDQATQSACMLSCQLYRILSLYNGGDYILEELYIKGKRNGTNTEDVVSPVFMARYFTHMVLGHEPCLYQFANVPDWFAIGQPNGHPYWEPHPGYGFATDVHASPIRYFHRDTNFSPEAQENEKRLSWYTFPSKQAKCLHLFMRGKPDGFDSRTGDYWYRYIYQPLTATLSIGD